MITRRATDQGVTFLDVETPLCTATLCLQGAHLTSWKPEGQEECLFLSPNAVFAPGKAIRGGIPVCWPWFGPRKGEPSHGVARTSEWRLHHQETDKRGNALLSLAFYPEDESYPAAILRLALGRTLATLICLGIMVCSLAAVAAVYYAVQATANDGNLLDLDNIELSQSSTVVATDPDTGAQVEYATLRSSNSHRVWADLEQIPTNLQYAFICTEDKDFYSEPGVNFKRTIGAMINEYLLPIYIGELLEKNAVTVQVLPTHDKWFGVTYKEDKQTVIDSFAKLVADGVYQKNLFSDLKH